MRFSTEEGDSPIFQPQQMEHLDICRRRCQPMHPLVVRRGPRRCSTEERKLLQRRNTNATPPALSLPLRTTLRREGHHTRTQILFNRTQLPGTDCTTRGSQTGHPDSYRPLPLNWFHPSQKIFETITLHSWCGAEQTQARTKDRQATSFVQNHKTTNTNPIILVCQIRFPVSWRNLPSKTFLWPLPLRSQYISPSSICQCLLHAHLEHATGDQFSLQTAGARIHILTPSCLHGHPILRRWTQPTPFHLLP
jgi:hypothetical protein